MPTYVYYCEKCDKEFEAVHSIKEELEECPTCKENGVKSEKPKRLISLGSFVLKGDGWAADSYSKK